MNAPPSGFEWSQAEPPLPDELARELIAFWESVFEISFAALRPVLAGEELGRNHDKLYLAHRGKRLAGTSHLTVGAANPELGGLGEVATASDFRGQGIAGHLSACARDRFLEAGGRALYLGTVNPAAERLYHRLGWHKLDRTHVMCLASGGHPPESFLDEYFRDVSPVQIDIGNAGDRIRVIPLIMAAQAAHVLDANLDVYSRRAAVQGSCLSLYPRYARLRQNGRGEWFTARAADGRLVGLATALFVDQGCVQVDGFTHPNFHSAWNELMGAAIEWALGQGAGQTRARVAVVDTQKRKLFESLGFAQVGSSEPFEISPNPLDAVRLDSK